MQTILAAPPTVLEFPTVLDNTMVSAWRDCAKKFWWRHVRLQARSETSIHLISGGAYARGLEVTRKAYFNEGFPLHEALAHGAAALYYAYGHVDPIPKYAGKSAHNLVGALSYYFETWPIEAGIVPWKDEAGKRAIEWNFAVTIPDVVHPQTGKPIQYCGRFDMVGLHTNGMIMGEDDKTTSQLGQSWYDRWRLSNQILGYCWGAREHGINLAGFNIRGVSLLKIQYGNAEAIIMVNPWQIDRFVVNLVDTVKGMIHDWKRNVWRFDFGHACSAFGGCDYLPLCESPEPETWLPINFVTSHWNPLASRD